MHTTRPEPVNCANPIQVGWEDLKGLQATQPPEARFKAEGVHAVHSVESSDNERFWHESTSWVLKKKCIQGVTGTIAAMI